MNKSSLNNKMLHSCKLCQLSFNKLTDYKEHMKTHEMFVKKTKKKPQKKNKRKKKKNQKNYCTICCRYYCTAAYLKCHMNKFHHDSNVCNLNKTNTNLSENDNEELNISTEFENEFSSNSRYDEFRCKVCGLLMRSLIDYTNHEKNHYQATMEDNDDNPNEPFLTLDDNNTSSNSIDGKVFDMIECPICLAKFGLISDFEEHKNTDCNPVKCGNFQNSMVSETLSHNLNHGKNNSSVNTNKEIVLLHKVPVGSEVLESRMGILNKLCFVPEQFECEICHSNCDKVEHLEFQMWWSLDNYNLLECSVCYSQFLDKNHLQLHQAEHINYNIC